MPRPAEGLEDDTPTLPVESTVNTWVVPSYKDRMMPPVSEFTCLTANTGAVVEACMERRAKGEEVPMPRVPAPLLVVLEVLMVNRVKSEVAEEEVAMVKEFSRLFRMVLVELFTKDRAPELKVTVSDI